MSGRYRETDLEDIFERTSGYCRYCGKKLAWSNYGRVGERGAWEVDHGVPLSRGGADCYRNWWPACVSCNTDKGVLTGQEFLQVVRDYDYDRSRRDPVADLGGILIVGLALAFLGAMVGGGNQ